MTVAAGPAGSGAERDALRIVVPRYGASVVGGAESAMRSLGRALAERGWRVEVWTTTAIDEAHWSAGYAPGHERDGAVAVRALPGRRSAAVRGCFGSSPELPSTCRARSASSTSGRSSRDRIPRGWCARSAPPSRCRPSSPRTLPPHLYGLPAAPHPRILCPAAHDEPPLRLRVVGRALAAADALWFHSEEERRLLLDEQPGASPFQPGAASSGSMRRPTSTPRLSPPATASPARTSTTGDAPPLASGSQPWSTGRGCCSGRAPTSGWC